MAGISFSIDIERPVEQVFDFATDTHRLPVWPPGVTQTVDTPDGRIRLGARIRRFGWRGRRRIVSEAVCTEFVRNERIVWRSTSRRRPRRNVMTFESIAGGTRCTLQVIPEGWFALVARLAMPMLRPLIGMMLQGQLAELKTAIEAAIDETASER